MLIKGKILLHFSENVKTYKGQETINEIKKLFNIQDDVNVSIFYNKLVRKYTDIIFESSFQ